MAQANQKARADTLGTWLSSFFWIRRRLSETKLVAFYAKKVSLFANKPSPGVYKTLPLCSPKVQSFRYSYLELGIFFRLPCLSHKEITNSHEVAGLSKCRLLQVQTVFNYL